MVLLAPLNSFHNQPRPDGFNYEMGGQSTNIATGMVECDRLVARQLTCVSALSGQIVHVPLVANLQLVDADFTVTALNVGTLLATGHLQETVASTAPRFLNLPDAATIVQAINAVGVAVMSSPGATVDFTVDNSLSAFPRTVTVGANVLTNNSFLTVTPNSIALFRLVVMVADPVTPANDVVYLARFF